MIGLGHGLGMKVIAEGVQTPEQLATLRVLGCKGSTPANPCPPHGLSGGSQRVFGSTDDAEGTPGVQGEQDREG